MEVTLQMPTLDFLSKTQLFQSCIGLEDVLVSKKEQWIIFLLPTLSDSIINHRYIINYAFPEECSIGQQYRLFYKLRSTYGRFDTEISTKGANIAKRFRGLR